MSASDIEYYHPPHQKPIVVPGVGNYYEEVVKRHLALTAQLNKSSSNPQPNDLSKINRKNNRKYHPSQHFGKKRPKTNTLENPSLDNRPAFRHKISYKKMLCLR